jgi:membrane protein
MVEKGLHGYGTFRIWLWREPVAGEDAASRFLRAALRITIVYWHEFWRDDILLRASALTFTVILSIVPVLALSTSVLKGLGAGDQMRKAAYQFIDTMAASTAVQAPPGQAKEPAAEAAKQQSARTFASHLKRAVDTIFDYVNRTNFATLGIVGLIGLFITVIMVLAAIEDAMNVVWNAKKGRPIGRKVMDYLALMLLLPLAVNIGMAAMAVFQSKKTSLLIERFFPVAWAGPLVIHLLSIILLIAILTIFYRFLPNTRVNFRPALIGGIIGALGWLLIQAIYIRLQVGVARYNAIYGSFATLPLFLLWVYSSWVVFLSGAEFSYATHVWRHYAPRRQMNAGLRLALSYDLLGVIYDDFRNRHPTDPFRLGHRLDYTDAEVEQTITDLRTAGYLQESGDSDGGLMPSTCADQVRAEELVDVVWGTINRPSPGGRLAAQVLAAAKSVLADLTLQDLSDDEKIDQSS